jgi:hypothetical protein
VSAPGGMAIGEEDDAPHTRYLVLGCKCSFSRGESRGGLLGERCRCPQVSD